MDSKMNGGGSTWRASVPAALVVLSFLSSGAWLLVMLPPVPMAKALNLVTLGIWLLAFGVGAVRFAWPDARVLWALGVVFTAVILSFMVGGSQFAVAFYDLYADMPLVQWLAFPAMFWLSAGLKVERRPLDTGLSAVVVLGTLMSAILAFQQVTTNGSGVFGSTAYSITALVPLVPLAVWLGGSRRGPVSVGWYACAVMISAALGVVSGAVTGSVAVAFALLLSVAIHPRVLAAKASGLQVLRFGALALAGLMIAAMVFIQLPAASGRWLNPDVLGTQKNAVSRVYLWQGAQAMVVARPILGFGPSGYRVRAVDYLNPEALQFGADQLGNADPTVYSPQSPHSIIWEIGTRLGVVGLIAFGALLLAWAAVLTGLMRTEATTSGLRAALAAGFASAVFAMMVNPVVFAIGLFVPVAAGLAIAPMTTEPRDGARTRGQGAAMTGTGSDRARTPLTMVFGIAGVMVVVIAVWVFVGEWRGYTARFEDPAVGVVQYESALRVTPGNPIMLRRLLENRLLLASDADIGEVQAAVDAAPGYIRQFGPNLSNFAAYSLAQAQRTGRKDLAWEQRLLTAAASQMPPIPSTVSEQLHLAVLSGDVAAVNRALPDAERWGRPYPYLPAYLKAAEQLKGSAR